MLGYSETLFKISDLFQSVHTPEAFFYMKIEKPSRHAQRLPEKPAPHQREEFLEVLGSRPHPRVKEKEDAAQSKKGDPGRLLAFIAEKEPDKPGKPEGMVLPASPAAPAPAAERGEDSRTPVRAGGKSEEFDPGFTPQTLLGIT